MFLASLTTSLTSHLHHLPSFWIYVVVAALVFVEAGLFVGFIFPGETAVLVAGAIASTGKINIAWLCVVVVGAAIMGNTTGYAIGNRFGHRMLDWPLLRSRRAGIERALVSLNERGLTYVIVGRFTAFLRAVMPALAGMSAMSHRRFQLANVMSALVWAVGYSLIGYYAGKALTRIESDSAWVGAGVLVAVIAALVLVHFVRRRRHQHDLG